MFYRFVPASLFLALALPACATSTLPLLPLPSAPGIQHVPAPANPVHFTFAVSGDSRSTGRGIPPPPTAEQIFRELRLIRPAFALWTGDSIYGSDDSLRETEAEYDSFLATVALSAIPVYNTPGNHEIYDRQEMAALYEKKMGRLYGSFDYGNSHFVCLNTEEIGATSAVRDAQLKWLEADLAANSGAAHTFIFMHHPLFSKSSQEGADNATRKVLHALFVKRHVEYVISGHEHLLYQTEKDGVHYIVTGGGGAPTDGSPEDGGFQHYLLFRVNGKSVSISVLAPWRLFATLKPVEADGGQTAVVANYQNDDLPLRVEFQTGKSAAAAAPIATWTYKGTTHDLESRVVPGSAPGVLTIEITVPAHRSAFVRIQ